MQPPSYLPEGGSYIEVLRDRVQGIGARSPTFEAQDLQAPTLVFSAPLEQGE